MMHSGESWQDWHTGSLEDRSISNGLILILNKLELAVCYMLLTIIGSALKKGMRWEK